MVAPLVASDVISQCAAPQSNSMKLYMTTRKNETGYTLAQVRLQHSSLNRTPEERETGTWIVDVSHDTESCEGIDTVTMMATVTGPPLRAGPGYEMVPGIGYYKFHTQAQLWEDARRTCAREGAHLAIINNEVEAKALQQIFARYPSAVGANNNDYAFIGVNDINVEGQYVTIFGQDMKSTGFSRWMSGKPNNGGNPKTVPGHDCVTVYRTDGSMNDLPCTWKLGFFCEQEL
uniref:C-type lectin domain-containing protein n=1 Tax=Timema monikensis TaxID=170555 RepID=A0A7R9E1K8_9NEOP|nr:unnamed protein product [Timema monikensis]